MQKVRYFLIGLILIGCTAVHAQGLKWYSNFDQAKAAAKSENKPMFLFFTGSDWCGWCKKLKKEVLDTSEFAKLAGDKYIFVDVDFPQANPLPADLQRQNDQLVDRYSIQRYPTVIIANADGKKLAQTGYLAGGPKNYAQHLSGLVSKVDLRDAVLDFQAKVADTNLDVHSAIQPLVSYLEESSLNDDDRWKVEMTLAQYLHKEGCDEAALAFASAGLADAPASHQPDIQRFLTYLDA